ncbi:translation initiation factor IF-2 [Lacticaseibacillus kribbianus]|uniref:translation initiation factor IF-2 n=1 Tax=Lacticaseibacillus kribbianus TaxID=2926292 RepID=UPI001CD1CA4A|nr:translation initiation factor IF-2 [Lacticaseibacillus kribbianus]
MGKKRVYEFAKELNLTSKQVIDAAKSKGIDFSSHMATIDAAQEATIKAGLKPAAAAKPAPVAKPAAAAKPTPAKPVVAKSEPAKPAPAAKPAEAAKPAARPAAEKPAPGTHHTVQKTADGKTLISKSAIRRPKNAPARGQRFGGGQGQGGQGQNRSQGGQSQGQNRGGRGGQSQNNRGGQGQAQGQTRNGGQSRNNNQGQRPAGQGQNGQQRERRNDRNDRFATSGAPSPRPRAGRATQANSNPRPVAGNDEKFIQQLKDSRRRREEQKAEKQAAHVEPTPAPKPTPVEPAKAVTPSTPAKPVEARKPERNRPQFQGRQQQSNDNRGNSFNKRRNKKNKRRAQAQPKKEMPQRKERPLPEKLIYTVGMNAQDLGKILHREPAEIIKKLFMLGVMVNQNQSLDKDAIELIATDYGIEAEEKVVEDIADIDTLFAAEADNTDHQAPRPPVVTIMGHVDHGKTTLLDKLRHTHVTEGEAGGITQHIGAYQVRLNDRLITFLDTPGHAAFTNMRARGADITDIIVLVVAADDGVMPQTIEAINHAKAAHAPIIVAVNKIDKPGANPNHVMEQLTEYGLIPEDWGGDTIFVQISAKFGKNIDELLEMILLEADVLELKANPKQKAIGTVIEAKLDKGRGPVTTVLVQQGTLHVGDPVVVGNTFGRIRVMTNDRGRRVKEAVPAMPVEITGLNDVPQSADKFVVFDDEKSARAAGEERAKRALDKVRQETHRVTLDNLFETMKEGQLKEVDVIIKGDVQGSVEALAGSLNKIEVEGVRVNIIHQAVGAINESDVTLASASNAIIIGFNVRPTPQAKVQADADDVDIRLHRVIYKAIEEIESAMKGMLEPTFEEKIIGSLTVRETINVSKIGTVAGAFVDTGFITRDAGVRLIRDGIVIHEGKLGSLRRFKDDVKKVTTGFELGLTIENYNDIKVDDQIEAYTMEEVPVK